MGITSSSSSTAVASSCKTAKPFAFHMMSSQQRYERAQKEYLRLSQIDCDSRDDFATSQQLHHLNRYSNILAYQSTIFPTAQPDPRQYICGNLVPLDTPHRLVAAQAPVAGDGIRAWWNVIVAQRISLIIMLTKEVENGFPKADRYWPSSAGKTIGVDAYKIRLEKETAVPEYDLTVRFLTVLDESGAEVFATKQVHYVGWPDHGIPTSADAFNKMIDLLDQHPTNAPVLVHCSAGIGRTGTLIGYYAVKTALAQGRLTDKTVHDVVATMKKSRRGMVQSKDQYYFIYQCLMEEIERTRSK